MDWAKRTDSGFGQAGLAKRSDSGKKSILPRIDWLAWVCGGLRQDGLGRSPQNKIFCPLSGHDGQDRLAMRGVHRFWEGCAGYCVGNLGEFGGKTPDGKDGLGERGRAQRMGRIWREKGTERWEGEDGLGKSEEKNL